MFRFLRKLLLGEPKEANAKSNPRRTGSLGDPDRRWSPTPPTGHGQSRIASPGARTPSTRVSDKYFALSAQIEAAKRRRDFRGAIDAAGQTYPLLKSFVGYPLDSMMTQAYDSQFFPDPQILLTGIQGKNNRHLFTLGQRGIRWGFDRDDGKEDLTRF